MRWHLNEDISFCKLDNRLFFLDIQRDRYFQLPKALERSLLHYLESPDDDVVEANELVRCNLLTSSAAKWPWDSTDQSIEAPTQSVIESANSSERVPAHVVMDVLIIVCKMRWQLKTFQLKSILQRLDEYRQKRVRITSNELDVKQRLFHAATAFNYVRPYIPIDTCCLIDSLAMIKFLAKQGLHAHLVMGVACDPFSAHAWAQHGSLLLNETVGTAQAHVPIRVI